MEKEPKEYVIGEEFELKGKKYKCVEDAGNSCPQCAFFGLKICHNMPPCTSIERIDRKSVMFIEISSSTSTYKNNDSVEHPSHYTSHPSGIECIDITKHHNFCIGNVIKYCWRAGLKDVSPKIEDLKKARKYLEFEIKRIEDEKK